MTPELQAVADLRHRLWAAGYRPVPVLTNDKKPSPAVGWPDRARQNPPECIRFDPAAHVMNTGVLLDGLRGIDLDVDDGGLVEEIHALAVEVLGGDPPVRYRDDSPRRLLLYAAIEGTPATISIRGPKGGVQILGRGSHALSFGHHPDGAILKWIQPPDEVARANLTAITEEQVQEFLARAAALVGASVPNKPNGTDDGEHVAGQPEADIERIADAFDQIPNAGPPDWEWWNKLGMALWAATGGSEQGRKLWHDWSVRNACYDAKETEKRWKHYRRSPPTRLGAGTVFHTAQEALSSTWTGSST